MLRTCILLSCSFFSFAVNADNPVPVNIFGATATNVINHAPTNVSGYVPASTAKPVSANPVGYVPASAVRPASTNKVSYAPTSALTPVPANAVSHAPASAISFAPSNSVSRVPTSTVSPAPVNVASYAPSSAVKPVSANTASYVPTSASSSVPEYVDDSIWLLVDTKAHKIEVKKGEQTLEILDGVAIGRKGAGLKTHRGDDITPYGNYRIGWIGEKSQFRKFFGLTYPSVQDAEIALKRGVISQSDYYSIKVAQELNQIPPQNTPLGGQIGIHGIGSGDERIHHAFDWTHGCIALTNNQIDHLSQWLDTGTVVKIK
jgi:hypothetical protein